jgi:hypothetical protein
MCNGYIIFRGPTMGWPVWQAILSLRLDRLTWTKSLNGLRIQRWEFPKCNHIMPNAYTDLLLCHSNTQRLGLGIGRYVVAFGKFPLLNSVGFFRFSILSTTLSLLSLFLPSFPSCSLPHSSFLDTPALPHTVLDIPALFDGFSFELASCRSPSEQLTSRG